MDVYHSSKINVIGLLFKFIGTTTVYNITKYVFPSDCQGIQIGDNNQLTLVAQAQNLLENAEEAEGETL